MVVFEGYSKTNKRIAAKLIDGHLYIVYTGSGIVRRFNDEFYTEDSDFRFILLNAGFRT